MYIYYSTIIIYIQGQGIIDPSRYTARGMGADKLQEYIKLYLRLQYIFKYNVTKLQK